MQKNVSHKFAQHETYINILRDMIKDAIYMNSWYKRVLNNEGLLYRAKLKLLLLFILLEVYRLFVERFSCPNDPESFAGRSISF
jgi:hypothetical protein